MFYRDQHLHGIAALGRVCGIHRSTILNLNISLVNCSANSALKNDKLNSTDYIS